MKEVEVWRTLKVAEIDFSNLSTQEWLCWPQSWWSESSHPNLKRRSLFLRWVITSFWSWPLTFWWENRNICCTPKVCCLFFFACSMCACMFGTFTCSLNLAYRCVFIWVCISVTLHYVHVTHKHKTSEKRVDGELWVFFLGFKTYQ